MNVADKDRSGTIDQEEFLIAMKSKCSVRISKIIEDIKKYAIEIVNRKQEKDIKAAFAVLG